MKKYIKVVLMVVIVVLLVAACAPAAPASRLDAIKKAGKIVVGTSADYEPWEYKDANGNFVGIDMEIMREIGKRMGVEVEFQDLGFDALVTAVQEGKVDAAIAAMASTTERRQSVDFSEMYYAGDNSMLVAKDSTISFLDPLKAAAYKIGTQSGTIMYTWVQRNLIDPGLMKPGNLFLYERNEQVALDLQAGRIDIAIMDEEPAKQFMKDPAFGFKEVWRGVMETEGQSIAIKKGETALKAELDKNLTAMINEGFISNLLTKYGVEQ
jgi:polar amino acid transport system substrate-binding protein